MLVVLHGENALQRREALNAIIEQSGLMPDLRDMNTEVLEGAVSPGDLRRACSVMPFLGEVRVVIARDAFSKSRGAAAQAIVDVLASVPPTTILIFDEEKTLPKRHPVLSPGAGVEVQVHHFAQPDTRDLPRWVRERVAIYGGTIEPRAAAVLAQNIGANLLLLDQEIRKLLLYVGEGAPIRGEDVQVMVPYVQSADVIFQMVDALGQRDPRRAATDLHRLLDVGEHPLGIFGMIVRQFRLLLQIRWMSDRHQPQQQIVSRLKLHPYVVRKVLAQAERFTIDQLREAYRLLMQTDLAIKRGEFSAELALDLLIAQLTRL
jgi:DNA polymerase III subunit delta